MSELQLTSTAFQHGAAIPKRYTCEGEDRSPPLAWTGLPQNTHSVALIVDDPDAAFAQAVSQGATVVSPVVDQPYGWRVGRVVDPFGHHWEIGKPLAE